MFHLRPCNGIETFWDLLGSKVPGKPVQRDSDGYCARYEEGGA